MDVQTILWEKSDSTDDLGEYKGPLVPACLCFHWLNFLTDQLFYPWISHGFKQDQLPWGERLPCAKFCPWECSETRNMLDFLSALPPQGAYHRHLLCPYCDCCLADSIKQRVNLVQPGISAGLHIRQQISLALLGTIIQPTWLLQGLSDSAEGPTDQDLWVADPADCFPQDYSWSVL